MSDYFETVPFTTEDLERWFADFDDEAELEVWIADMSDQLARFDHERRTFHDRNGWYADLAYDAKCLALGHERSTDEESGELEDVDDDELSRDGTHVSSWDGEYLCGDTRYGQACTECEGECEYLVTVPNLWAVVAERAEAHS